MACTGWALYVCTVKKTSSCKVKEQRLSTVCSMGSSAEQREKKNPFKTVSIWLHLLATKQHTSFWAWREARFVFMIAAAKPNKSNHVNKWNVCASEPCPRPALFFQPHPLSFHWWLQALMSGVYSKDTVGVLPFAETNSKQILQASFTRKYKATNSAWSMLDKSDLL